MKLNSTRSRPRIARRRTRTQAAGALVAAPLAAWLALGLGSDADSANGGPNPSDLTQKGAAPAIIEARATVRLPAESRSGPRLERTTLTVSSGDTLIAMLKDAGLSGGEAFRAVKELQSVYSPRKLRPGQDIKLALLHDPDPDAGPGADGDADSGGGPRLARLALRADAETDVAVERIADGFEATSRARDLARQLGGVRGKIDSSLFAAGDSAGVPARIMLQVIHQYSYAVDFQRDLRQGDRFEIVFERFIGAGGKVAKTGPLLYASLEVGGETLEMYRYAPKDGEAGYFAPNGESIRRLLMRTPIDGARLSSGYGMRKHPIKGYTRMHEGVDFAAPRGTPIYASGNGRIERIGYNGGYGNYVRIDHGHGFTTAYGHMKGFARGLSKGAHVSQGEVIGYVGNTGQSTGPHLHYEIHRHGEPVNPRGLDLPTGRTLTGAELKRFERKMARIDRLREAIPDTSTKVAKLDCSERAACE